MKANTLIWRGCQSGHCWMYRDICMSICIYALTHTPEWTYTPWAHIDTYISVIRLAYRSVVHSCLIEVTYFDGNCCISNGCLSKTEVIDSNRSSPMRKCNPLTFFFFFCSLFDQIVSNCAHAYCRFYFRCCKVCTFSLKYILSDRKKNL